MLMCHSLVTRKTMQPEPQRPRWITYTTTTKPPAAMSSLMRRDTHMSDTLLRMTTALLPQPNEQNISPTASHRTNK